MQKEIHQIQAQIFKKLLLRENARFSDLKPKELSSDQFTFHLKKLVEDGIVNKREDGTYELTLIGKEYANRFDTDSGEVRYEKQAKLGVLVVASRTTATARAEAKSGTMATREFVMQKRLKHPFFGFRGFITGKIKIGESVTETARRELLEETGLDGTAKLHFVYHERIYSKDGELLEDKYFFVCLVENSKGELMQKIEGGENQWVKESDVAKGDVFYDIKDIMTLIKSDAVPFLEKSYVVEKY